MAPKTLPPPRPGTLPPSIERPRPGHGFGQTTFVPDFSTFGCWSTLQLLLEILFSGRQMEQLWRPGSPYPGNLSLAMATLFPGTGPVNQSQTAPELYMVARSQLCWVFQVQPGSTLPGNPDAWSPFMLYLTLPLATFQQAMATAQQTGHFVVRHSDVQGTLEGCLNLSLSLRSAYLFFTFHLSIMQQQYVTYTFPADAEIATVGFRPTQQWLALYFGSGRAKMWNRRYVDFLIKLETLELAMDPTWPTFICIRHFQGPYQLVSDLNRYFNDPACRHFMLMHLPLLPEVYRLSFDQPEGWVPLVGL